MNNTLLPPCVPIQAFPRPIREKVAERALAEKEVVTLLHELLSVLRLAVVHKLEHGGVEGLPSGLAQSEWHGWGPDNPSTVAAGDLHPSPEDEGHGQDTRNPTKDEALEGNALSQNERLDAHEPPQDNAVNAHGEPVEASHPYDLLQHDKIDASNPRMATHPATRPTSHTG